VTKKKTFNSLNRILWAVLEMDALRVRGRLLNIRVVPQTRVSATLFGMFAQMHSAKTTEEI